VSAAVATTAAPLDEAKLNAFVGTYLAGARALAKPQ